MKNAVFVCLSAVVGIIGFFFTIVAAFLEPQEGHGLVEVCCLSYFGVIAPAIALEIAKFLCFKHKYKKIYTFDIIGIIMCLSVIIILNLLYLGGMNFWAVWKHEFFLYQFPWLIALIIKILMLTFVSKKKKDVQEGKNEDGSSS